MNRLVLSFLGLASIVGACAPSEEQPSSAPATTVGALEAFLTPYTLTGKIRIGMTGNTPGECAPGGVLRRVTDVRARLRDVDFTSTGVFADLDPGAHDPDNARNYSATLQRDVEGELVTYQWRNNSFPAHTNSRFFYGGSVTAGSTREFRWGVGDFTSPPEPATSLVQDVLAANAASLTLEVETDWTSTEDDVVSVTISATASGSPNFVGLFNTGGCYSPDAGALNSNGNPCSVPGVAATAQTVNGFIRRNVLDGGGAVTAQRTQAELLLLPGRSYTLDVRVQLRDGIVVRTTLPSGTITASQAAPCATLTMTPETHAPLRMARPPQTLQGRLHLAPDDAIGTVGGVRPTGYYITYHHETDGSLRTGYAASGGLLIRPSTWPDVVADWSTPLSYAWRGIAPGRYYMGHSTTTAAAGFLEYGHVRLSWGDPATEASWPGFRPEFFSTVDDTGPTFYPLYRYPLRVPQDVGLDADGFVDVAAGATVTVDRIVPMAYLRGRVELLGCNLTPGDVGSGAAEIEGLDGTGTAGGFARGLFRAGTYPPSVGDGPGHFEVAASSGAWRVRAYRLRLDGAGGDPYDGHLFVWPEDATPHTLVAGRLNQNTDLVQAPQSLELNKIAVTLIAPPGMQMRNPVLRIGRDTASGAERIAYTDASGTTTLGTYTAVSRWETLAIPSGPTAQAQLTPVIFAMTNSTVTVTAFAEVSSDGVNWSTTGFTPSPAVELAGACGQCVIDADTILTDDELPPAIAIAGDLDPAADTALLGTLAAGTTSLLINGTATDGGTPVVNLDVGAQAMTLVDNANSQPFSTTITGLVPGDNVVTITARDCVGNTRTITLIIRVAEPLCPPVETPDMCEADPSGAPAPGSAFYVNIVGPTGTTRAILCTVATVGAAPVCDPSVFHDVMCGN